MKKLFILSFGLTVAVFLSGEPTYAQRGGGVGGGVGGGNASGQNRGNPSTPSKTPGASDKSQGAAKSQSNATISDRIESNPQLTSKVQGMLPAGMALKDASSGFKNEGQFIAALHVSKNLNIPFAQLKSKMTGGNPESLGKAIQDLRPDLGPKAASEEAKKAEKEAKETEHAGKAT